MKVIVTIEREDCIACALCWESCPEVFREDPEDGFSRVVDDYMNGGHLGRGLVPVGLKECVETAAEQCPVDIIQIAVEE